jgi:OOP family OmpA-OmpF porin
MKNLFEHFKNILKTRNMNQIIKHFMLFVITVLFTFNLYAQQTTKPNLFKYTPLKQTKWSMYSLYKVHVQDFGVTEKYNDTCNCLEDVRLLDKSNTNLGLSFYKNVDEKFAYSVDWMLGYGYVSRKTPSLRDKERSWMSTARADFYYYLTSRQLQLQPYAVGGLHASLRRGTLLATFPVGMGVRYMFFNNRTMVTLQVGYGLGLTNRIRNSVVYSSGLYVNLDKKQKPKSVDLNSSQSLSESSSIMYNVVDTDGDGITDSIDKCPTVPGLAINNGCLVSDRDGDGVVDQYDKCADVAGDVKNEGCPVIPIVDLVDRDKDGIADSIDVCPDMAGTLENKGCPVKVVASYDTVKVNYVEKLADDTIKSNDNKSKTPIISSSVDFKPMTPIISSSVDFKPMVTEDLKAPDYIIYFDFNKRLLKSKSIKILNDVVKYMQQHPNVKVSLKGHADLEGNIKYNKDLSMRRVQNARYHMTRMGIVSDRIVTDYYGKTKPVVETMEKSIGWKNRRVEIFIIK